MNINTINILNRIFGTGVFSKDEVNTVRQIELDIAKGFTIFVYDLGTHGRDFQHRNRLGL